MFDPLLIVTVAAYVLVSLALFCFAANLVLFTTRVWRATWAQRRSSGEPTRASDMEGPDLALVSDAPRVTVQLPIFNELYVAERIIDAAAQLDWPRDLLQIQVLDDSTDETSIVIEEKVAALRADGLDISHLHRTDRTGYKAGALGEGMKTATGDYIAIFDADFVPEPDFLRQTIAAFDSDDVAFVQARWGHLNRDHSWLTRFQAIALDAHFLIDQANRGAAGYWFNFNGTAGVWRAAAITDAGGWNADTLTEDLDLSYRAHIKGWRARFCEDVCVPAELPVHITGFRRQQHRWARGSMEVAIRQLRNVWRTDARWSTKWQATIHLTSYASHLLLLALLLLYLPLTLAAIQIPATSTLWGLGYLFGSMSIAPMLFFSTGRARSGQGWVRALPVVFAGTLFGAGLMVNTARAFLQIRTKPNPEFERTAKFGLANADSGPWTKKRYQVRADRIVWSEFALATYGYGTAVFAMLHQKWGIAAYATAFSTGLVMVAGATVAHALQLRRSKPERTASVAAERLLVPTVGKGPADAAA